MSEKKKAGRPSRDEDKKRVTVSIKLTQEEYKEALRQAEKYKGNMNKLYRVKVFGEK